MAKSIFIVDSPTKAKTFSKYLRRNYQKLASIGHFKDLPKSKLGMDLENNFDRTVGRLAWALGWNGCRRAYLRRLGKMN